jgi:hypothetical protein
LSLYFPIVLSPSKEAFPLLARHFDKLSANGFLFVFGLLDTRLSTTHYVKCAAHSVHPQPPQTYNAIAFFNRPAIAFIKALSATTVTLSPCRKMSMLSSVASL